MRKQIYPFYCWAKEKGTGKEMRIGMEITEGKKEFDEEDYTDAAGRVVARFFNTTMPKDTQIRYTMEPGEAFRVYVAMMKVFRSNGPCEEKLPPHKFKKDGMDLLTNLVIQNWVNGERSGLAVIAYRNGISHNVSMKEDDFLYAAEVFKAMSVQCNWQLVPAPAINKKQEAIDALSTFKVYLVNKPGSLDLLKRSMRWSRKGGRSMLEGARRRMRGRRPSTRPSGPSGWRLQPSEPREIDLTGGDAIDLVEVVELGPEIGIALEPGFSLSPLEASPTLDMPTFEISSMTSDFTDHYRGGVDPTGLGGVGGGFVDHISGGFDPSGAGGLGGSHLTNGIGKIGFDD